MQIMPEETAPPSGPSTQPIFNPDDPASFAAAAKAFFTFTRAPDFKAFFCDMARSRLGNGTITLVFGKLAHAPSLEMVANIIEEHAEIAMSWTQLKMLVQNWSAILSAIETHIGPIPIPASFHLTDPEESVRGLGLSTPSTRDAPSGARSR
jgi:hypothetical protein